MQMEAETNQCERAGCYNAVHISNNYDGETGTSRKAMFLTLQQKLDIIAEVERGERFQKEIAKSYGINPMTVRRIIKDKSKYLEAAKTSPGLNFRRKVGTPLRFPIIDQKVLEWVLILKQTSPIDRKMVIARAKAVAREEGIANFSASQGWAKKFMRRHALDGYSESVSVAHSIPRKHGTEQRKRLCEEHMVGGGEASSVQMEKIASVAKKCEQDGCNKIAIFDFQGGHQICRFCKQHKMQGMVDVRDIRCDYPGCRTIASCSFQRELRGRLCEEHKLQGRVDSADAPCEHVGCGKLAFFNFQGETKGRFCVHHKLKGMLNVM
mmetsp:Transcript_21285/g.37252  ORF Transcript_21285/g.37252 Transcript_21285/m.37252 type:complete len:323 (+) Transcript_21285:227-1195(+)|eukprot:CAMPEP_0206385764 /NCGR_PEP_ID=MMETSP0294-20121207/15487_1 /ASSEMBLY_ACC=CAM_ASM_000327 /TAXON_ID=39354 /ORGANISM="Heterosigma akashiwo, Strain CCMP2393" /LENGTH=322 /DNA_ID=CAMNT_0053836573 /DNA_START=142 /DNA_END=1110 /DNA_ORIENTATION=-